MADNNLSGALQENVLTLLCFDTEACAQITGVVAVELFESTAYRRVAERATEYFRKYKEAPNDHLPDLFQDLLDKGNRDAPIYARTLRDLHGLSKSINRTYVLNELHKFVRLQTLRRSVIEAAELINAGSVDEAESVIAKGYKQRVTSFEPGMLLTSSFSKLLLHDPTEDLINTGIRLLDQAGICPAPGEMWTFMAPPNRGKSWALVHVGKYAALQRKRVCHITLEMNERKVSARYLQSYFSMPRRAADQLSIPVFNRNSVGMLHGIGMQHLKRKASLYEREVLEKLGKRAHEMKGRMQIVVKQFPTSSLTLPMLESYLEMLHAQVGFVPDVLIIDYPDLMKIAADKIRVETGAVLKELRGLAVERNVALVVATQSNREGEDAKLLSFRHLAEDYSKAMISDNIVTYSQTKEEKELGLARLFVAKGRDEKSGQIMLITQAYALGQFCLDSIMLGEEYGEEMIASAKAKASPRARLPQRG